MSWPAGVISVLEMENNVTDEIGTYAWTNNNGVTFSSSVYKYGAYSADFDAPSSKSITSDNNVSGLKTIEFWMYKDSTESLNNNYLWRVGSFAMQSNGANGIRLYNGSTWSAFAAVANDTWTHVAITF